MGKKLFNFKDNGKNKQQFKLSEHTTLIGFLCLVVLASILGWPDFLRMRNIITLLRQVSYTGIIALGMTLIIISGGFDLSVGSMTAFAGGVAIFAMNKFTSNIALGVAVGVLVSLSFATLLGLINGLLVTKGKIAPFIATLGTMSIYRSLIIYFAKAGNIESLNTAYGNIGSGVILGLPVPVWCFFILAIFLQIFLDDTKTGKYICAVGANEQVAKYSAINLDKIKLIPYVITGFTVGVSALLWSSRLNCINPSDCSGYELDAIAAVVIGGTPMSGGIGSVLGTVIGAIMLGIINNMLVLAGVSSYLQQAAKGLVIIIAVLVQYKKEK
ncbi:MAG: ABC transporter permease [Sphaerochaetaceae bacterium]|nr:ABC transporter permease [Sphaerochaetaceae bacterium]MDC7238142.1 ABC transporter permease [Sphaerochaetaceae bacterium]